MSAFKTSPDKMIEVIFRAALAANEKEFDGDEMHHLMAARDFFYHLFDHERREQEISWPFKGTQIRDLVQRELNLPLNPSTDPKF